MEFKEININETHIRLTTDLKNNTLPEYILNIRTQLKTYIQNNQDFLHSLEALEKPDDDLPLIVEKMYDSSIKSDVGPMACVAGTISELSLDYLISKDSKYSLVENGGDIALINNKKVLCGIYSNNPIIGNDIAFEIKARKRPLGICTSSGKIGHSISFGAADSVTVISKLPSLADGLATRIANEVKGENSEDKIARGLECCENFKEYFEGALLISDENVGSIGKLPKIVESKKFDVNMLKE